MELIHWLMDELDISREQAEGAAGALLELARHRISAEQFVKVADTIPAISDVIGKAPRFVVPPGGKFRESLSRAVGGLGGLKPLVAPFAKLQLDKLHIRSCASSLTRYFGDKGGPEVQQLLAQAWR